MSFPTDCNDIHWMIMIFTIMNYGNRPPARMRKPGSEDGKLLSHLEWPYSWWRFKTFLTIENNACNYMYRCFCNFTVHPRGRTRGMEPYLKKSQYLFRSCLWTWCKCVAQCIGLKSECSALQWVLVNKETYKHTSRSALQTQHYTKQVCSCVQGYIYIYIYI